MFILSTQWGGGVHPGMVAQQFDAMGNRIGDFRQALERVVNDVARHSLRQRFVTQGEGRWQPITFTTQILREEAGYPPLPTMDRRRGAIGLKHAVGFKRNWSIGQNEAVFDNLNPKFFYAEKLHTGFTTAAGSMVPGKRVPARPIFYFTNEDIERMEDVFIEHMDSSIRGVW